MLEVVLDRQLLVILMGIAAVTGILSKCVAGITLKRLVRAAGNMNKSSHALIKLIRAKFEHACMVSDRVQNVGVFVEKYLYEYRTVGLKLHTWRRMERGSIWLCVTAGLGAAAAQYAVHGMSDVVLRYGAGGAGTAILLFLFYMTGDEKYQMEAARNYMVDYLENVCARRYEKTHTKDVREELHAMAPPETEQKMIDLKAQEERTAVVQEDLPPAFEPSRQQEPPAAAAAPQKVQEEQRPKIQEKPKAEEKPVPKEVLIREILEEFLA